MISDTS